MNVVDWGSICGMVWGCVWSVLGSTHIRWVGCWTLFCVCVCCHLNQADFGVVQDVIKNQWSLRITENPEKSTPTPEEGSFFGNFGYHVGSALHLISNNYGKKAKKTRTL